MKKVFLIHGFEGEPNGGWRPFIMEELQKIDVYACALSMPTPDNPICAEWVEEIERHVKRNMQDEIFLVGHSLGAPTILRFLEKGEYKVKGIVLVSGPIRPREDNKLNHFLARPFDFETIKKNTEAVAIIHGDNDSVVSFTEAEILHKMLGGKLISIPNGGHLNGSSGWAKLPQCLEALKEIL